MYLNTKVCSVSHSNYSGGPQVARPFLTMSLHECNDSFTLYVYIRTYLNCLGRKKEHDRGVSHDTFVTCLSPSLQEQREEYEKHIRKLEEELVQQELVQQEREQKAMQLLMADEEEAGREEEEGGRERQRSTFLRPSSTMGFDYSPGYDTPFSPFEFQEAEVCVYIQLDSVTKPAYSTVQVQLALRIIAETLSIVVTICCTETGK